MPRSLSLSKKKDFDQVFKKGQKLYSRNFTLFVLPSHAVKLGIIVKKKDVPFASHRNYSRRLVRSIIYSLIKSTSLKPHYIALLCKSDLTIYKKEHKAIEIEKELTYLLKKLNN